MHALSQLVSDSNSNQMKTWNRLWEDFFISDFRFKPNTRVIDEILKILGKKLMQNPLVLEVGSGSGSDCIALTQKGVECFALDYSIGALEVSKKLMNEKGVHISILSGDCRHLPFKNEAFDAVFSVGLVEHFEDSSSVLCEQSRVLKQGGFLVLDVPQKFSLYTVVKHVKSFVGKNPFGWETEFSIKDLSRLSSLLNLKCVGFYYRDSAFQYMLPKKIKRRCETRFNRIENSVLTFPLSVGAIYRKKHNKETQTS